MNDGLLDLGEVGGVDGGAIDAVGRGDGDGDGDMVVDVGVALIWL